MRRKKILDNQQIQKKELELIKANLKKQVTNICNSFMANLHKFESYEEYFRRLELVQRGSKKEPQKETEPKSTEDRYRLYQKYRNY